MSKKRKEQRAMHEIKQREQGEKVVRWIAGGLIVLAIAYAVYAIIALG